MTGALLSWQVFSRNLEDNTSKYPDIAAMLPRAVKEGVEVPRAPHAFRVPHSLPRVTPPHIHVSPMSSTCQSFILDAEAVAMDRQTGEIKPFQVLSTRKRKDASVDNITVQACPSSHPYPRAARVDPAIG